MKDNSFNDAVILKILASSNEATAVYTSRSLQIGFINNSMMKLWNKRKNLTGFYLRDVAPEFNIFIPLLEQVWDTGIPYVAINRIAEINIGGKLVPMPFDFEYKPILDSDGRTYAIINTASNVSEREQTRFILQQKEKNAQLENDEFLDGYRKLMKTNEELNVVNLEYQNLSKTLLSSMEELAIIKDEADMANLSLQMLNDDLQESKEDLSRALEAANLGNFDADMNTGVILCSDRCNENFGRAKGSSTTISELVQSILPGYREKVSNAIHASFKNNKPYDIEYQVKWPDGSIHWVQVNALPRYDEQGIPSKMVGFTQLVTDKKNYQLRKDEFLSVASHELKTPISVLSANLQLLDRAKHKIENRMVINLIESCNTSISKVTTMLEELLDVGRYAEGNPELNKKRFDLLEVVEESCLHLIPELRKKIRIKGQNLNLLADRIRIEQVIVNFINNACKYAPDSEFITVEIFREKNSVKLALSDQGPGIPESQIPFVFNRYWQSDSFKNNGSGLGLYISAEIIRKHQGEIGVESQVGVGTTFWFRLPLE